MLEAFKRISGIIMTDLSFLSLDWITYRNNSLAEKFSGQLLSERSFTNRVCSLRMSRPAISIRIMDDEFSNCFFN